MSMQRKIRRAMERNGLNKQQRAINGLLAPKHCSNKVRDRLNAARKLGV